jgi:hypothetical protein
MRDGYKSECKSCMRLYSINYNLRNSEKHKKWMKDYRKTHVMECHNYSVVYNKNNRGKKNSFWSKYKANKLQATPQWLTIEDKKQIKQIYEEAHELSWLSEGGLHVDHIIPLQGENVCGFHVPWNLQILPARGPSGNCAKSNKI